MNKPVYTEAGMFISSPRSIFFGQKLALPAWLQFDECFEQCLLTGVMNFVSPKVCGGSEVAHTASHFGLAVTCASSICGCVNVCERLSDSVDRSSFLVFFFCSDTPL